MWNNKRRVFNLIRSRNVSRGNKRKLVKSAIYPICFICFIIVAVFGIKAIKNIGNIRLFPVEASNSNIDIYVDNVNNVDKNNDGVLLDSEKNVDISNVEEKVDKVTDSTAEYSDKTLSFVALGEIMMGGQYSLKNTSYTLPFVDVAVFAKDADYTVASLATNIVDLDIIENPKSKYIVTDGVIKGFNALGIRGINIASDHMMDFGINIFNDTKDILANAKLDTIGIQDDIVYAEANGIKVAFIGMCNEIIGSYLKFTDAGIWMYDDYMVKLKEAIAKAKTTTNTVVVITHLGSENNHEINDVMSWFSHKLIDIGADMVLGNHALGVYPIEIYNSKPIIYSLGYFFSDTEYEIGKKSGIFKFTVNTKGKITDLEFMPTYIANDKVEMLYDLDKQKAVEFMKYISSTSEMYGYEADISNKLSIKFK